MAYSCLQGFMERLEAEGELVRISATVDPELEITEITDRVCKSGGPALLFERVKGSSFPVLTNAMGSYKRMSMALEAESLDAVARDVASYLDVASYQGLLNQMKSIPKLARLAFAMPKPVPRGICQEVVVRQPDLGALPILKCWPKDGGRFITLPLVVTADPETHEHNVGMYRMQVFDSTTTGMHWHLHKDGRYNYEKTMSGTARRMPVSVALGCDPAMIYAATAPLPRGVSEYVFAGFLRRKPVELVKCVTNDLMVPANAEFIIEGYVEAGETRIEGPFGDHTGYYSLADRYPVFHVECITHRRHPVYPATIVGKPPMEDCYMAKATERIFLPLLKGLNPEIVNINLPLEGVFHNCAIVSIAKRYPGHAKKVMNSIWGMGQMMFTKMIIVVDEDVDPYDVSTVAWKVFNNIDPKRDILIVDGPLDALDHASPLPHYGHKMGIDATKKWPEEGHPREWPDDISMEPSIKELVSRRWAEYGL